MNCKMKAMSLCIMQMQISKPCQFLVFRIDALFNIPSLATVGICFNISWQERYLSNELVTPTLFEVDCQVSASFPNPCLYNWLSCNMKSVACVLKHLADLVFSPRPAGPISFWPSFAVDRFHQNQEKKCCESFTSNQDFFFSSIWFFVLYSLKFSTI